MRYMFWVAGFALLSSSAFAEPLTGRDARKELFRPGPIEVEVLDLAFLTEQDKAVLDQIAQQQRYYGAIAFGPDDGLLSESLMGAFNYHDVDVAMKAAMTGCEKQRAGAAACEVVAVLRPKGWEAGRALSLSGDATEAYQADYRRAKTPKALAISPSTGLFAVALEAPATETALESCEAAAQAGDCEIILVD